MAALAGHFLSFYTLGRGSEGSLATRRLVLATSLPVLARRLPTLAGHLPGASPVIRTSKPEVFAVKMPCREGSTQALETKHLEPKPVILILRLAAGDAFYQETPQISI